MEERVRLVAEAAKQPVTFEQGEAIKRKLQKQGLSCPWPPVVLSYATQRRPEDAEGCGPGMLYAEFVSDLLMDEGINCFSGLHVPAGDDWEMYFSKINGRRAECKVLVVIQTDALFKSKPCMWEIHEAMVKAEIPIIPLVFEGKMPRKRDCWANIEKSDHKNQTKLDQLDRVDYFDVNSIPAPPHTVLSQPKAVETFLQTIKHILSKD